MNHRAIPLLPGECWWGGCVNAAHTMPITKDTRARFSPVGGRENDQFAPLYVSSAGRYLWSERPFDVTAEDGTLV